MAWTLRHDGLTSKAKRPARRASCFRNRTTEVGVITERIAGIKEDIGKLEGMIGTLQVSFDKSATKQGERIGALETANAELRRDFHWSTRLAAALWALVQGAVLLGLRAWLLP